MTDADLTSRSAARDEIDRETAKAVSDARVREERLDRIRQAVHDLVEPFTDRQPITDGTRSTTRRVRHPSILDQLRAGVDASQPNADGSQRPVPSSCPPPGTEAGERLDTIAGDVRLWLGVFGLTERETLEANLRALVGAAPLACEQDLRDLDRDTTWYARTARVYAGWQTSKVFAPHGVACYMCGVKNLLRVRLDLVSAVCLGCETTWDRDSIGVLADHVAASGTPLVTVIPDARDEENVSESA